MFCLLPVSYTHLDVYKRQHVTFGNSAEVDWYIKADDLVLKTPAQNSQPHKDVPADKKP